MLLQTGNIQCDHKIAGVWEIKGIISHNLLDLFFAVKECISMDVKLICASLNIQIAFKQGKGGFG